MFGNPVGQASLPEHNGGPATRSPALLGSAPGGNGFSKIWVATAGPVVIYRITPDGGEDARGFGNSGCSRIGVSAGKQGEQCPRERKAGGGVCGVSGECGRTGCVRAL